MQKVMKLENVIGQILDGKYKIEKELGRGGMGTVFLATHVGTERPVAVKVIAPEFMERAEFVERFRREARAAGRLRHPNVVDVTDFGFSKTNDGSVAYLVMEYLDGCTLGEILEEEKKLPLGWTIDILEQISSAVHEAHKQGIIHRDLKPDNIWLEPNQRGGYTVKVLDFGIAKLEEAQVGEMKDLIHISTMPTREINRKTVADHQKGKTVADHRPSTVALEAKTFAQTANDNAIAHQQTISSEAGTMIQTPDNVDLESGTAILPATGNHPTENDNSADEQISGQIAADNTNLGKNSTAELTRVGSVLGTPLYMSPEQCRGDKLSPQSDVYSLGVIAFQMLSGKTPFTGDFQAVMDAHQELEPPDLDVKKVPKKVKNFVHSALSKNPLERPLTAQAFASKLRANAEGLGELFRRGSVIYSQHLPKFLLVAFLTIIPFLLLTILKVSLKLLALAKIIDDGTLSSTAGSILGVAAFFVQIFCTAFLVGMTTWIVAQILAFPLRPISLRAAFREAKRHWKPLLITVTTSTLLVMISWGIGFVVGGLISMLAAVPLYFYVSELAAFIVGGVGGVIGAVCVGLYVSSVFMLIAPSIIMENLSGMAAFRRSMELSKRAFRTVLTTSLLVYIVPMLLGFIIVFAIGGIVKGISSDLKNDQETSQAKKGDFGVNVGNVGINITNDEELPANEDVKKAKEKAKSINPEITAQIFELIWIPVIILFSSFTSVITALLYFKTRQAGGRSMGDLLDQFEETDRPKSNWQKRIRERIQQSGKLTGNS